MLPTAEGDAPYYNSSVFFSSVHITQFVSHGANIHKFTQLYTKMLIYIHSKLENNSLFIWRVCFYVYICGIKTIKQMAKKQKKRNEIRVTDIPDTLFNKIVKSADKADRSLSKEVLNKLKGGY